MDSYVYLEQGVFEMKTELRDNWITALRSGKYNQAREVLHGGFNSYCCLGVLCKVAGAEFEEYAPDVDYPDVVWENRPVLKGDTLADEMGESLKSSFLQEIGLSSTEEQELIKLNDDERFDFIQIADHIEKNIPGE